MVSLMRWRKNCRQLLAAYLAACSMDEQRVTQIEERQENCLGIVRCGDTCHANAVGYHAMQKFDPQLVQVMKRA
jgi:hypothetical protein